MLMRSCKCSHEVAKGHFVPSCTAHNEEAPSFSPHPRYQSALQSRQKLHFKKGGKDQLYQVLRYMQKTRGRVWSLSVCQETAKRPNYASHHVKSTTQKDSLTDLFRLHVPKNLVERRMVTTNSSSLTKLYKPWMILNLVQCSKLSCGFSKLYKKST